MFTLTVFYYIHEVFNKFKIPFSINSMLSSNLISLQIKYVSKSVAKNDTFLDWFFIGFETKNTEKYRFLDRTLFGAKVLLYILTLTRLNVNCAIFKNKFKLIF